MLIVSTQVWISPTPRQQQWSHNTAIGVSQAEINKMSEYNESLSRKTLSRALEPVIKVNKKNYGFSLLRFILVIIWIIFQIGYMDGASDGQTAVFQDSFNVGYKQGFAFGLELGSREAISRSLYNVKINIKCLL